MKTFKQYVTESIHDEANAASSAVRDFEHSLGDRDPSHEESAHIKDMHVHAAKLHQKAIEHFHNLAAGENDEDKRASHLSSAEDLLIDHQYHRNISKHY